MPGKHTTDSNFKDYRKYGLLKYKSAYLFKGSKGNFLVYDYDSPNPNDWKFPYKIRKASESGPYCVKFDNLSLVKDIVDFMEGKSKELPKGAMKVFLKKKLGGPRQKVFAYKGQFITASSKEEAITKIIASKGAPLSLRNEEARVPKEITNEASAKKFIEKQLKEFFKEFKIDSLNNNPNIDSIRVHLNNIPKDFDPTLNRLICDYIDDTDDVYTLEGNLRDFYFDLYPHLLIKEKSIKKYFNKVFSSLKKHFPELSITIYYPDKFVKHLLHKYFEAKHEAKQLEDTNRYIKKVYQSVQEIKKHLNSNIHKYADVCVVFKDVGNIYKELTKKFDMDIDYELHGKDFWMFYRDCPFSIPEFLDDIKYYSEKYGKDNLEIFFELK